MLRSRLVPALALLAAAALSACGETESNVDPQNAASGGSGGANEGGDFATGAGGAGAGSPSPDATPASRSGGNGQEAGALADTGLDGFTMPVCESGLAPQPFYLSADDSNSMASPAIAREDLLAGRAPDGKRIRTYEFLNYYNVLYDLADPADPQLGVFTEMHPLTSTDGIIRYRLQVGVQAFEIPRVPLVLTFVVDASGSLVGEGIERERAALTAIADELQQGDVVNIVKWATNDGVLLQSYLATGTAADQEVLAEAAQKLAPGGGSDLHAGLVKGYELANQHFDANKLNRVVLISDGGANLGVTDRSAIAKAAASANDEGIFLVGIGVGPSEGYSDVLMDLVTDAGRGAYVYADSAEEAKSLFHDRFDEIMNVAARDVQVELSLPPYIEIEEFYGEEYSTDPTFIEPQNLAPGDSMVFNQTVFLTDPTLACGEDTVSVRVTWETPLTHLPREVAPAPVSLAELSAAPESLQARKANAIITYAEALKSGDPGALGPALDQVSAAAAGTSDPDLAEIAALLALHPALKK
ncbi:MAG: VWA domain-containing protein [Polyangiaceae bacterium]